MHSNVTDTTLVCVCVACDYTQAVCVLVCVTSVTHCGSCYLCGAMMCASGVLTYGNHAMSCEEHW